MVDMGTTITGITNLRRIEYNMNRDVVKGRRLLVLGGNTIGQEMRQYADRYGVTLITAGNNPHAPAHRYSDEQYYFDVADKELFLPFVKDKHIDGILSFTGEALLGKTIQTVADTGLPYHYSQKRWDTLMDKVRFKEAALRHGVSVLRPLTTTDAVLLLTQGKKVVVKPTRAGGSFGITVCDGVDMLDVAIRMAKKWSSDGSFFIERFLEGDYFQFEIWCSGGKRFIAYTKDRVNYPAEPGCARQPFCDIYPSTRAYIYNKVFFEPLCSLFDEIGLSDGSVQFQGIIENNVPYIMDVAYRVSGGMDFKVPCRDKGVDLVAGQMDYALTGEWIEDLSSLSEGNEKNYLTLSPGIRNGRIAKMEGLEEIKALPYVYDYFQYYDVGDDFHNLGNFLQVFCRIFIEGTSRQDLFAKVGEVMRLLKITDESGQDMLLKSPEL